MDKRLEKYAESVSEQMGKRKKMRNIWSHVKTQREDIWDLMTKNDREKKTKLSIHWMLTTILQLDVRMH